jgi:hypothetical protein
LLTYQGAALTDQLVDQAIMQMYRREVNRGAGYRPRAKS